MAAPESVNPGDAVRALEQLAYDLRGVSEDERNALRAVCVAPANESESVGLSRKAASDFYRSFLDIVGLGADGPSEL